METLCQRLDACQEKILDCFENDSKKIEDHIVYWKAVRHENVVLYKARQNNITKLRHQVVPCLQVCKAKACVAIEIQMALESLYKTEYKVEEWTLKDVCENMWHTAPKQCFKKSGKRIEVWFDGKKDNRTEYVVWQWVYYCGDNGWTKVPSVVDYKGIYYVHDGNKVYYTDFNDEAVKYGYKGTWEVHMGNESIYCPDSVSSTLRSNVSPVETVFEYNTYNTYQTPTTSTPVGANEAASSARPGKRPRTTEPDSTDTTRQSAARESHANRVNTNNTNNRQCLGGATCYNTEVDGGYKTTPVVHLKGEPNRLKCLRYRCQKHKHLFVNISSTYHWTNTHTEYSYITVVYKDETQRANFLNVVKIPPSIQIVMGHMTGVDM
uniref:Regulatory protein E2 n=1 Tax=Human papillomavirus 30 TaxID=10611 RepID=A0A0P0ELJ6_HPV30|nr:early protein E2 [human papillomavirus 30]ALJ32675.1 early protein E2 [human papillomavirus 30]